MNLVVWFCTFILLLGCSVVGFRSFDILGSLGFGLIWVWIAELARCGVGFVWVGFGALSLLDCFV